ncbi:hypothetical protein [Novosphingobium rosa]|uniref:hypothetical protein n=1 Tax=Novosphingobium rosa TaxID=76978 RepID=UPI000ACDD4E8|nr:hypothetical protein [Novosphingobium rosa]
MTGLLILAVGVLIGLCLGSGGGSPPARGGYQPKAPSMRDCGSSKPPFPRK